MIVPFAIVVGAPKLLFATPDVTLFSEPTLIVPSLIFTAPVKVFAPDRVKVLEAPTFVIPKAPLIIPESVISPEVVPIVLFEPRVIAPLKVAAVVLALINAPAEEKPVPFKVKGSAVPKEYPFKSSTAFVAAEITVAPVMFPKGPFVASPAEASLSLP